MLYWALCFIFIGGVVSTPTHKNSEDARIVGGENIDISDAPYQVSIIRGGRHYCGGSIISNDIVITAAHCVYRSYARFFKVRMGSTYSDRGGQIYSVSKLIWHPDYNDNKIDSDVAILRISKPVVFSSKVDKIELANKDQEIDDGELTVVTGWGANQENGDVSRILQRVEVLKVNDKVCIEDYKPQYNITATMFCAGNTEGGKDACQGDSGGPLVYQNKLYGVVSWGLGCARPQYPGVYAKISALRKWLDINIERIRLKHSNILPM